jgi:hypothetical protein
VGRRVTTITCRRGSTVGLHFIMDGRWYIEMDLIPLVNETKLSFDYVNEYRPHLFTILNEFAQYNISCTNNECLKRQAASRRYAKSGYKYQSRIVLS